MDNLGMYYKMSFMGNISDVFSLTGSDWEKGWSIGTEEEGSKNIVFDVLI